MAEEKRLMKGNEAIGEAAVRAGCGAYFGYPITPQNELTAYMAEDMMERKRTFIQAESEIAAMSMVFGASAAGGRAMTSSSSPGVSLKQEGISYACGADIPCVIVNVARSGPGLGGISPSQGDYFQATRGGGHGDYYHIVLAPKSVQEAADLTYGAFELADKWRMPVMILADGLIGQMMEGVVLPPDNGSPPGPSGPGPSAREAAGPTTSPRSASIRRSRGLGPARFERYERVAAEETRFEAVNLDKAELIVRGLRHGEPHLPWRPADGQDRGPRAGPLPAGQPLALPFGRALAGSPRRQALPRRRDEHGPDGPGPAARRERGRQVSISTAAPAGDTQRGGSARLR